MKNLRQLFRRSGLLSTEKRRRRSGQPRRSDATQRRLTSEVLEKRELLAGDIAGDLLAHNYWNRYDVNDDGQISARDALGVINYMNRSGEGEVADPDGVTMFYDVNADNNITAADALSVINAMSRGEEVGELVELLLTARDLNDDQLAVDGNGDINVDVGQIFDLEVAYDDLRLFNERLGVFQLFTDLSVSQSGVLSPVLNETQRLIIDSTLTSVPSTSLTFTIEESPPGVTGALTYESSINDFGNNARGEVVNALEAFGYSTTQFTVGSLDFGNNDIGFQIHWDGSEFGNVDLPNISVEVNETNPADDIPTQSVEFAPFLADGTTPNTAAVRFNINSFSRTFNDNERFYSAQNRGNFDPATGFTGVGGLGMVPVEGGGIPDLTDDGSFDEPFDAFSLRVFINQPVTDLVIGVNPGEDVEATLLYGRDDAVPQDMVLINTANANITINASATGQNQNPVVSGPISQTFTEDDAQATVSLLTNASDPDGDTLSISTPTISGNQAGISVSGTTLTVTPSAYGALNNGQSEVITLSFNVLDGNGGSVAQTATITVTGITDSANQNPVVSGPISQTFTEDDAQATVSLLTNASDPDGDTLSISTPTISGNQAGISVSGTTLTVTPGAYGTLNNGQSEVITLSYNVLDGNGGSVAQTATITVTGITDVVNQNPVVSGPISQTFTEDDAQATVSLLTNASDPDGDTLSISTPTISGNQAGISVSGTTLTVTPGAYGALDTGQSEVITLSFNVLDGNGGTVAQTATITVTGITDVVNQNPVVSGPVSQTFTEDDAQATVSLLTNASDPDGDALSISTPTISGNQAGISVSGTTLTVTPGAYGALDTGQSEVITLSYNVLDGNGGSVAQTATITVTGITDVVNLPPVVSGPVTAAFNEQDAAGTVNLLNGASDPEGDTLTVSNVSLNSGDDSGITVSGSTLNVNPGAYNSLVAGETATIIYTYNVSDGVNNPVSQSATVTINGFNDPPVARDDNNVTAFVDTTTRIQVLANDDAGGGENQTLTIVAASSSNGSTTPNADGTISFTPSAGFVGGTTISYTIEDSQGKQDSATVFVTVQNFNPSAISGAVFIDHVENLSDVIAGADPIRNGVKESDESGLTGVPIRLVSAASENVTGEDINLTAITDIDGSFGFDGVAPGNYRVVYDVPSTVIYLGPSELAVTIGSNGGETVTGMNFALLGTQGSALNSVDILASSYLRTNPSVSQISDDGREGGLVSLKSNGDQDFLVVDEGFDGIRFAELVLNAEHDAALLTVIEDDGDVMTARLSSDYFVVTADGLGVQFFGGLDDFTFVSAAATSAEQEFANFRNAIDQVLAGL